jgi:hypothetical protein
MNRSVAGSKASLRPSFQLMAAAWQAILLNGHGAGFFAIDVLAGAGGKDRGGAMPAVAGGDDDGVDIRSGEQLVHVNIAGAVIVAIVAVDGLADDFAVGFLDVGNGDEVDIGLLEETFEHLAPARSEADSADGDAVVGGAAGGFAEGAG